MARVLFVATMLAGLLVLGGRAGAEDDVPTLKKALQQSEAKVKQLEQAVKNLQADLKAAQARIQALSAAIAQATKGSIGAGSSSTDPAPEMPTLEDPTAGLQTSHEQMRMLLFYFTSNGVGSKQPWPSVGGKNFVLWLVAKGYMARDVDTSLEALFSRGDKAHRYPGMAAYKDLTVEKLSALRFPALTSYAGRRNAEPAHALTPQILAAGKAPVIADLSYPGGAIVGFTDGTVRWISSKELGLSPGDPLVAGDSSKSPLLRSLGSD